MPAERAALACRRQRHKTTALDQITDEQRRSAEAADVESKPRAPTSIEPRSLISIYLLTRDSHSNMISRNCDAVYITVPQDFTERSASIVFYTDPGKFVVAARLVSLVEKLSPHED